MAARPVAGAGARRRGRDRGEAVARPAGEDGEERQLTAAVAEAAPAKLTLFLHVVGRRPDGFHLLESLFAFTALGDAVTLAPADDLSLTITGRFAAALDGADGNLVTDAARALASLMGRLPSVAITLEKTLPVAAGLGGGSADAAATLRGLCRLWGATPARVPGLPALALRLGADVPACIASRPVRVSGIGEGLAPAPALPPAAVVLVNPGTPLSTPAVFRARTGPYSAPGAGPIAARDAAGLAAALATRRNDLTEAAVRLEPAVAEALGAIEASPGCLLARLAGSGATCFGLFGDDAAADRAAAAIARAHPSWWSVSTRLATGRG